ncbi:nucleotide-binding domain-containing protein [Lactarius vividus]|nr:nucleotide-binding domain-containing protein [Lactarius vividus]
MANTPDINGKNVVVIGAGVIGLSTAITVQERGDYSITILAETLPTDSKCIKYTSHWAGAHHVSAAGIGDLRLQNLERKTFDIMWEMSAPGGEAEGCFLRAPQTDYYVAKEENPDLLSFYPDFQRLEASAYACVPEAVSAVSFSTLNINTPAYLTYLLARFLSRGGRIVRASIQHVAEVLEGGVEAFTGGKSKARPVDALIICVGLGARTLGGVEDKEVYPVRGQTVLLRAPWIEGGRSLVVESVAKTYIVPRRDGTVIVGGTRVANDWFPKARPETTINILERGLALYPELAPPSVRDEREPTVEDLKPLIIEEGCGLRPARKDGIRIQSEWIAIPGSESHVVPIIHNYGYDFHQRRKHSLSCTDSHGGYGFQTSWGSALAALTLLEGAFAKD